jgi:hypothetical protein
MFKRNHLIISGDIPASDYSDISSLGRRSGGAEPRERHGIRLQAEIGKIHAAAPGGRPGGGSGTCSVDLPGKSLRPNNAGLSRAGSPSGGAKPRECCILENNLKYYNPFDFSKVDTMKNGAAYFRREKQSGLCDKMNIIMHQCIFL